MRKIPPRSFAPSGHTSTSRAATTRPRICAIHAIRVALTGAADERPLVEQVYASLRRDVRRRVWPLAGRLSFAGLGALIEMAHLTVTNNTGPMHIAAAVKTPVAANPPEQWGPWPVPHRQLYHDVPCRICYSPVCPYAHECLRLVSPEQVIQAARELLYSTIDSAGNARAADVGDRDIPLASLQGGA